MYENKLFEFRMEVESLVFPSIRDTTHFKAVRRLLAAEFPTLRYRTFRIPKPEGAYILRGEFFIRQDTEVQGSTKTAILDSIHEMGQFRVINVTEGSYMEFIYD